MPTDGKTRLFGPVLAIAVLAIGYILSIGPVLRFTRGKEIFSPTIQSGLPGAVWRPVLALDGSKLRPVFRSYMKAWGVCVYDGDY
jgi:hypothetical protein